MFLFEPKKIERDLPHSAYTGIIKNANIYDTFFMDNFFWEMIILAFLMSPLFILAQGLEQGIRASILAILTVGAFGMVFGVMRLCILVYQSELLKFYPGSQRFGSGIYSSRERRIAIIKSISVPLFLVCFPVAAYAFFQSTH